MAKREYFRIPDFSGGYNPDRDPTLIADNEATVIRNLRLDETGALVSRKGWNRFYDTSNVSLIQALGRWRPQNTPTSAHIILKDDGGRLRRVQASAYTTLETGLDTTERGEFAQARDLLIYANGVDRPRSYDGTTLRIMGVDAPVTDPTVALIAGSLTGTYQYKYTYYDSTTGAESNPSDPVTATPSAQGVRVSVTASSQSRVSHIRIYRTTDGGATFLYLDQIANATTTYDDTGATALSAVAVETDNAVPANFEHVAYHQGYIFGSDGDTLYWSKALDPDAFPALNNTVVPFEGNDDIQALVSHQDTLLIFGRQNVLLLAGQAGNWTIRRVDVSAGLTDDRATAQVEGQLIFLDYDGLKIFPGFGELTPNLNRELAALTTTVLEDADLSYVPQERALYLRVDGKTYWIHLPNQAVSIYELDPVQWLAGGDSGFEYPLFIDADGLYVNQYGSITSDNGAAFPILWRSKQFFLNNPELTKVIRRIGAYASQGSSSTVSIIISDDLNTHTVTLSAEGAGVTSEWGSAIWGPDPFASSWSSEGITYFIGSLPGQTLLGRIVQIDVSAEVSNETTIIPPITLEYRSVNRFL